MTCVSLTLACLLLTSGPPIPEVQLAPPDHLDGRWNLLYMESDGGQSLGADWCKNQQVVIKANVITWCRNGNPWSEARFRLDPLASPPQLDMTFVHGEFGGKELPGIYRLEGDTLQIRRSEGARPREFTKNQGTRQPMLILKRAQPKP